ncbi:MAG: ATP-binding protein [Chitinophagales bacterium]
MDGIFQRLYRRSSELIQDEITTARYLLLVAALGFAAFAMLAENEPMSGPVSHHAVNWIDAIYAFFLYTVLTLAPKTRKYYKEFAYSLIYLLNIGNIYILHGTAFSQQYAYQFIVVYTISGWFFRSQKSYFLHTGIINSFLIAVALLTEGSRQAGFDFYATFVLAALAQYILIRYRFAIEERLMDSEQKYRLLAEHSFDLICVHSADGTLEFASPSIKRLFGYEPEELIGRKPYEITHPDDKYIIRALNLKVPNHHSIQHPIQYRLRHKNGTYIWIETIFVPLQSEDGETGVVLSQTRDIRRSKNYQLQLEERTHELERSNADLETFAFVSSHDMQEPLRMIANYMQLLKRKYSGKLDAEADEYIEFANKGAINLSQLIKDLLSYSRITRTELNRTRISMKELVNEVTRSVQLELQEKNAVVEVEELCEAEVDRNLMLLVIQNLILNAIKYNNSGAPTISISCEKKEGEVIYCFADNGIGIDPKHQQRIFEPFHRLHTKAEYPGTGLGLSTCKKIIERHGGKIWIDSTANKGSKFYFSLPRCKS